MLVLFPSLVAAKHSGWRRVRQRGEREEGIESKVRTHVPSQIFFLCTKQKALVDRLHLQNPILLLKTSSKRKKDQSKERRESMMREEREKQKAKTEAKQKERIQLSVGCRCY
jgi:hypothetical protein